MLWLLLLISTSSFISKLQDSVCCKYGKGVGSWGVLGTLKGSKASMVTIQGDMVVAKFFAPKGPKGMYSHFCMSLAANYYAVSRGVYLSIVYFKRYRSSRS